MNLGAFAVAAAISGDDEEGSNLASYRGLGRRRPWLAAAMTIFLLALAGLPPTAGFLGKILILSSSVGSGYLWLGALLIVGTAISLYAYAKVVRAMYAPEAGEVHELRPFVPLAWASAGMCAVIGRCHGVLSADSEQRSAAGTIGDQGAGHGTLGRCAIVGLRYLAMIRRALSALVLLALPSRQFSPPGLRAAHRKPS